MTSVMGREREGVPATLGSLVQIGSLSKVVSAIVALRVARDIDLDLDTDLRPTIGAYCRAGHEPITLRRLLGHTAGFALIDKTSDLVHRDRLWGPYRDASPPVVPRTNYLRHRVRRRATSGEFWSYANHHTNLLTLALEDLTGQPFGDLQDEALVGDGITPIVVDDRNADLSHMVEGRASRRPGKAVRPRRFPGPFAGGLGLPLGQLADLLLLLDRALVGGPTRSMLDCQRLCDGSIIPFAGTGVRLKYHRGAVLAVHGGNFNGHAVYVAAVPSLRYGITIYGSGIGLRSVRMAAESAARLEIERSASSPDRSSAPGDVDLHFTCDRRQAGSYSHIARHVVGAGIDLVLSNGEGEITSPRGWFKQPTPIEVDHLSTATLSGNATLLTYSRRDELLGAALTPGTDGATNLWLLPMIQRFVTPRRAGR